MNEVKTALLIMDAQTAIVSQMKEAAKPVLDAIAAAIAAARKNSIPVIYVVVGFRKNYPEVSPNNKSFSPIKTSGRNLDTPDGVMIDETVAPQEADMVVTKRRVSAFAGSDLEVVLRSNGIQHIVLTGFATSGVVLSTLREAADKDYKITVLSDCCGDADEEVHRVLTTKIFPRQADVTDHKNWIENPG
jgi:nicotinamidase-related amidase